MIKKKMYKRIKAYKRLGYTREEIVSALSLDPKTVTKYLRMDEKEFQSYRSKKMFRDKVLDKYEKDILEIYEKNEYKKLNMASVYDYLEERYGKLPGNEKSLRNFISYLIEIKKLTLNMNIRIYSKIPELPFGKQMQLDFGQYKCRSGLKLFIFAAVLSASRYKYKIFQDHPFKTREVINHLLDCFDYFGGVPEELVIDQDSLLVVSENHGDIIFTDDFNYFVHEQEIRMYVCRKSDPETKGKIESVIKYGKYNFFNTRDFSTLSEANESVLKWLKRRANGKISQATQQIPAEMIVIEREALRPVRNSIFRKESLLGRDDRTVNEKACIAVDTSLYQLPSKYRNKTVEVYITKHKLFVFDLYTGEEIIEYDLSLIPRKKICKREFTREKSKTITELKEYVTGMFDGENGKKFVRKNYKAFPRYARDQCIEAKKHFLAKGIDIVTLDKALEYCLENNTPSFSNLNDTYVYFKREQDRPKDISPEIQTMVQGNHGDHVPLNVSARDLSVYKEIISKRERTLS